MRNERGIAGRTMRTRSHYSDNPHFPPTRNNGWPWPFAKLNEAIKDVHKTGLDG